MKELIGFERRKALESAFIVCIMILIAKVVSTGTDISEMIVFFLVGMGLVTLFFLVFSQLLYIGDNLVSAKTSHKTVYKGFSFFNVIGYIVVLVSLAWVLVMKTGAVKLGESQVTIATYVIYAITFIMNCVYLIMLYADGKESNEFGKEGKWSKDIVSHTCNCEKGEEVVEPIKEEEDFEEADLEETPNMVYTEEGTIQPIEEIEEVEKPEEVQEEVVEEIVSEEETEEIEVPEAISDMGPEFVEKYLAVQKEKADKIAKEKEEEISKLAIEVQEKEEERKVESSETVTEDVKEFSKEVVAEASKEEGNVPITITKDELQKMINAAVIANQK